ASVGDCDEIVSSSRVGFILRNFNAEKLNSAADEFLSALRSKDDLRGRCRELAEKYFSLESGSTLYYKVYESII
ncbi:MAG TPA: glycosyltransferase, partial [Candidatus Omnitrophica bacterium]|nr:glycosyltransferase [Candidatus Omnitrophota bacterium]